MTSYSLHGLTIESAELLHERPSVSGFPDLRVVADPPRSIPDDEPTGQNLMRYRRDGRRGMTFTRCADDHDILRFHGMAQFDIHRERGVITGSIDPSYDPGYFSILLTGNVLNHFFVAAGDPVLHASAIRHDGRTIAFLARSGGGKSTLTAAACALGAELVGDDLLRLVDDGEMRCFTGTREIRVRAAVAEHALALFEQPPDSRQTADGRIAIAPPSVTEQLTRLDAIVVPRLSRSATELHVETLRPGQAAHFLLALPRMGSWTDPGIITSVFDATSSVAATVPVHHVTVPWSELPSLELLTSLLARVP